MPIQHHDHNHKPPPKTSSDVISSSDIAFIPSRLRRNPRRKPYPLASNAETRAFVTSDYRGLDATKSPATSRLSSSSARLVHLLAEKKYREARRSKWEWSVASFPVKRAGARSAPPPPPGFRCHSHTMFHCVWRSASVCKSRRSGDVLPHGRHTRAHIHRSVHTYVHTYTHMPHRARIGTATYPPHHHFPYRIVRYVRWFAGVRSFILASLTRATWFLSRCPLSLSPPSPPSLSLSLSLSLAPPVALSHPG